MSLLIYKNGNGRELNKKKFAHLKLEFPSDLHDFVMLLQFLDCWTDFISKKATGYI